MRSLRRLAILAAVVGLLATCSVFDYTAMQGKRYALVYGVSRYTMGSTALYSPNLQFPDSDASALSTLLTAQGYSVHSRWVDANGVVWVDGASTGKSIGALATGTQDGSSSAGQGLGDPLAPSKANILQDIQDLAPRLAANDTVLVYFSGHGTQDTSGTTSREYIDPYGSVMEATSDSNFYAYPSPAIRDDELGSSITKLPTVRVVLVLDTCNSGGFIGNMLESDALPPLYTGTNPGATPAILAAAVSNYAAAAASPTGISPYNATVISAAGRDESSYESGPPFNHGIMTFYLLKAAANADLNHDGVVTALEAYAYIKAGIDQDWNSDTQIKNAQETFAPHISGGPVDYVLF